jgi:hypothetical protein
MKKIFALAITMFLAVSLSFAQGTAGSSGDKATTGKTTTGKGKTKTKTAAKKGGKKGGKKSSGGSTTPAPK